MGSVFAADKPSEWVPAQLSLQVLCHDEVLTTIGTPIRRSVNREAKRSKKIAREGLPLIAVRWNLREVD
jgi:hypothetical protein